MTCWSHAIRRGALPLVLAGLLTNCGGGNGDGGGGGNLIRLFFGINGDGACNSVIVNVDLADASAILARNQSGGPSCLIDVNLGSNGCQATFTETGTSLRAVISGCTIPAVTNLFACLFEEVDLSDINSEASAQCVCAVPGCDGGPPLCIDQDLDPRSCEDCTNGTDDDNNGLTDCEDPNCEHSPECVVSSTTTSTTGPTVTSTTLLPETTTTTLPPGPISIDFSLTQSIEPLGALQFTVNYTSAPGRFVGDGEEVACTGTADDAVFAPLANDATSKLVMGFVSVDGIPESSPLASCLFEPDTPVPVPANFTVVIDEATDPQGNRVRNVQIGVVVTIGDGE